MAGSAPWGGVDCPIGVCLEALQGRGLPHRCPLFPERVGGWVSSGGRAPASSGLPHRCPLCGWSHTLDPGMRLKSSSQPMVFESVSFPKGCKRMQLILRRPEISSIMLIRE